MSAPYRISSEKLPELEEMLSSWRRLSSGEVDEVEVHISPMVMGPIPTPPAGGPGADPYVCPHCGRNLKDTQTFVAGKGLQIPTTFDGD